MAVPTQANATVSFNPGTGHLKVDSPITVAQGGTATLHINEVKNLAENWKATKAWVWFSDDVTNAISFKTLANGSGSIEITVKDTCAVGEYPYAIYCNCEYDPPENGENTVRGYMAEGNSHPVMIVTAP